MRLLADVPGHVTTYRGKGNVERRFNKLPHWNDPGFDDAREKDRLEREAWDMAVTRAELRMLRRATVEACARAGWLEERQLGPNDWNTGWMITDAGQDVVGMLGPEDFVDRPRIQAPETLTVQVMIDALKDRWHTALGWVWFLEFSPGRTMRRLDGLAVNRFWSKQRYERMAFEIKRSRGDFLAELKNPRKRQDGGATADRFWFVTPAGLVEASEVPGDCGLVWVDEEGRATIKRKAPRRPEPAPTDRALLGSILTYIVDRPQEREWRKAMKDL